MENTVKSEKNLNSQPKRSQAIPATSYHAGSSQNDTDAELTPQDDVERGLQIVHISPGRVRFRTTDSRIKSVLDSISQQLQQQDGISEVHSNQQTGSLVVSFNPEQLSLPQILGLLQQAGIANLQASLPEDKKTELFAAWKSVDFWKEQLISFIPLSAGLAATGGLGISGLPAIPVYLVTAGVTRRVIDYLQLETTNLEIDKVIEPITALGKSDAVDENNNSIAKSAEIAYKVVHAIPGRIRFNVPRISRDDEYTRRLQKLLKADAQVTNVRINRDAASVVISYKLSEIPENVSCWVDLIQLAGKASVTQQPSQEAQTTPTTETTQQFIQAQEDSEPDSLSIDSITVIPPSTKLEAKSVWADFKSPALCTSLTYMANFPL